MFAQKILFLFTIFTLMSWQDIFAAEGYASVAAPPVVFQGSHIQRGERDESAALAQGASTGVPLSDKSSAACPDFAEECNILARTAQRQSPLMGKMTPDVMMFVLKDLPFKDALDLLRVDDAHYNEVDLWKGFAKLHRIPLIGVANAAEQVRKEIMGMRSSLQTEIQSVEPITSEWVDNLLQRVQETPFLWNTLITAVLRKSGVMWGFPTYQGISMDAFDKTKFFDGVSNANCWAFLAAVAARKKPDGTPGVGADDARKMLYKAMSKSSGFVRISEVNC